MKKIDSFNFEPGRIIAGKYKVLDFLGKGWEGEVYAVKEVATGIERALKFFYPHRNPKGKASKFYAKKMHKLRHCGIIIQYYGQDLYFHEQPVTFLVSEFIEGELLSEFLKRQPGKRLHPYAALHLLHALASGMECIHHLKEYHGDLHTDNIIVQRHGLRFDLKLLDLYHWGPASGEHIKDDVVQLIHVFHEVLGGKKHYAKLPAPVKDVICGLKRSLILSKFKTAGQLKEYIEKIEWE